MKPRCGRCKGRGTHRPIGLGPDVVCEDCGGSGEKQPPKAKPRVRFDYERPAAICAFEGRVEGRECYGRKTWHHIVPREKIIARITAGEFVGPDLAKKLSDALSDPRVLIESCFGCHLGVVETANPDARVTEDDLPRGFWDYVREYGLESDVPRHLRELASEATT